MADTSAILAAPAAPASAPAAGVTNEAAPLAVTPPPAAGGGTPPAPAANASWYGEHIAATDVEVKAWADGKKFANAGEAFKAYMNAEKLIGGDPKLLVKLPAEGDSEAQGALWNKLGRPDKAEGYKLPDAVAKDETIKAMLPGMHALGLTQAQVDGLANMSATQAAAIQAASDAAFTAQMSKSHAELKAEWGQGFDRNLQAANAVIERLGLTTDDLTALAKAPGASSKSVIQRLAKAGEGLLEAKNAGGMGGPATGFGNLTPAEATAQWNALIKDPGFVARMNRNDPTALQQKRELDAARRGITPADFAKGLN